MPDDATEPVEQLLAAARAASFLVSRPQLRRWQQAGLLPSPTQRGLGRAQGTAVCYPAGTTAQLLRLLELLKQRRSFDHARWRLWWEGFRIVDDDIRMLLDQQLQDLDLRREGLLLVEQGGDAPAIEDAWNRIGRWGRGPLSNRILRRVRKRVSRERFTTFVLLLTRVVAGEFRGWSDDSDPEIFAKGLGLDRTSSYRSAEEQAPFAENLETRARTISQAIAPAELRRVFEVTSDIDLRAARDELRTLLGLIEEFFTLVTPIFGPGLPEFLRRIEVPTLADATLSLRHPLLAWLSARRFPLVQRFQTTMLAAVGALQAGQSPSEVVHQLEPQEESS